MTNNKQPNNPRAEVMEEMAAALKRIEYAFIHKPGDTAGNKARTAPLKYANAEFAPALVAIRYALDKYRALPKPEPEPDCCPWCGALHITGEIDPSPFAAEIDGEGEEHTEEDCPKCGKHIDVVRSLSLDRIEKR